MLAEAHAEIRQGIDPSLLERERRVQQQLGAKEQDRMQLLSGKHTQEQAKAVEKELDVLMTEYREVERQIRATSPRYAALTQPQPLSLKEIQQQVLDEDTLLLEYALGDERSFLWAVTPTSISSSELPKRADVEAAAKRVYDVLKAEADAEFPDALIALSRMLLEPVADQLGKKRLLIVADGALQYVPFGALPAPSVSLVTGHLSLANKERQKTNDQGPRTKDPQPLIADHEVVSLPSASVLAVLRREMSGRKPAEKVVAVVADPVFQDNDPRVKRDQDRAQVNQAAPPAAATELLGVEPVTRSARESGLSSFIRLPLSRQEAEQIAHLATPATRFTALDFEASKPKVTGTSLDQYRIVHFATHGLLNSQHPELSGIVLSLVDEQGQPQDGFLRLHEIYNLELNADLVVLSACQTALGQEIRGEGLIGLTRGFMYAGAPRVVASLWKVDDKATAELMKRFYQKLLQENRRPAAALRAAQLSMVKQKRWSAPYYWAGFVLLGEWK
jgi:CHAT domain-containing protein